MQEKIEKFNIDVNNESDFSETVWGEILINEFKDELYSCILELESIKKDLDRIIELQKYANVIKQDIENLEELKANLDSWDKAFLLANDLKWETWPRDNKVILNEKEIAKEKRDKVKKKFTDLKKKIFTSDSNQAIKDICDMYNIMLSIGNLVKEFTNRYAEAKKERNLIDFNDIEHFALKILVKKEDGKYVPTEVAKTYKEKFVEIAIDEYQDSNLVQEYILSTVSKGNNIFMVGDVKQSIYKFRQARPELFISKYEKYKLKEDKKENDNLKIQLFKNFRSRKNILDITNLVFENIMSKELGDIDYNKNEYLNLGANYEELIKNKNYAGKTELLVIDLKDKENAEDIEDDENEGIENLDNMAIEAKFVANKIQELIKSKYQVYDKKIGYRDITYKDIVILLRATSNPAPVYEKALNDLKLPVFSDTRNTVFRKYRNTNHYGCIKNYR